MKYLVTRNTEEWIEVEADNDTHAEQVALEQPPDDWTWSNGDYHVEEASQYEERLL